MAYPKSWAIIEFPASAIDAEIRDRLQKEGVQFKPQLFGPSLELDSPVNDLETEIDKDGIFRLSNSEAMYGEFIDLEEALIRNDIPFDRKSQADWQRPAELRIFRPGAPPLDLRIPQDPNFCGLTSKIRDSIEAARSKTISEKRALQDIEKYLNEKSPPYPPR